MTENPDSASSPDSKPNSEASKDGPKEPSDAAPNKKGRSTAMLAGIGLLVCVGIGIAVLVSRPKDVVIVGPDDPISPQEKRALFDRYAFETDYPENATEVYFHLEPGAYEGTDIHGEYVRFNAEEPTIRAFVESTVGTNALRTALTSYSQWHFGIGGHQWWRPDLVENPEQYEKGEKMITVDWANGTVYYSSVLRGLVIDEPVP